MSNYPHFVWPHIYNFHTTYNDIVKYKNRNLLQNEDFLKVTYKAKVKLDGTNAAIIIRSNGVVYAQSRTQTLLSGHDNKGFVSWLSERNDKFLCLKNNNHDVVIFGEWCGPGIGKNVAINKIDTKIFAVFAIVFYEDGIVKSFLDEPSVIKSILGNIDGVYVIDWFNNGEKFILDYANYDSLKIEVDKINEHILTIEKIDPWVKSNFNIDGIGEGLVFYPMTFGFMKYSMFEKLGFKAKGEAHRVAKHPYPAQLDPTISKNIEDFISYALTEQRLEQALSYVDVCNNKNCGKQLGKFLAWLSNDISRECRVELELSKDVRKAYLNACMIAAKKWFMSKTESSL